MSHNQSCGSYFAGHNMHWIHAKKAHETDQPLIDVRITAMSETGHMTIEGVDVNLVLWHHRDLRSLLSIGDRAQWRPRFHTLFVYGFGQWNVATPEHVRPCVPPTPLS
mgnify:CR=1 FL=1